MAPDARAHGVGTPHDHVPDALILRHDGAGGLAPAVFDDARRPAPARDGERHLTTAPRIRDTAEAPAPRFLDIDGDGDLDLLVHHPDDGALHVISAVGGSFAPQSFALGGDAELAPVLVREVDANDDGVPDAPHVHPARQHAWGDYDADGRADLALISHAGALVVVRAGEQGLELVRSAAVPDSLRASRLTWLERAEGTGLDLALAPQSLLDEWRRHAARPRPDAAQQAATGDGRRFPGDVPPDEIEPLGDDHNTLSNLDSDDHPHYLDTTSADTFSESSWDITADTTTTHDYRATITAGGTLLDDSTGGFLILNGNDRASIGGDVTLNSGDASNADVNLNAHGSTGSSVNLRVAPSGTLSEKLTLDESGLLYTSTDGEPLTLGEDVEVVFEGATDDANELTLTVADPSTDRTITIPNNTGTVAVAASSPLALNSSGVLSCPDCLTTGGTRDVELDCFGGTAVADTYTTDNGTSDTVSNGFEFANGTGEAMSCQWTVPTDYDPSSATEPSLRLMGFMESCVLCAFGCGTDAELELEVASKAIAAGEHAGAALSTTMSGKLGWASQSCSTECSGTCYPDDTMDVVTIDATDDAGDWQIGDAVYIAIQRDVSIGNNFPAAFHLSHVRLTYPTTE